MDLGIRVDEAPSPAPAVAFRWDTETEILAGHFTPDGGRGLTGTIEIQSADGAVVAVDVEGGVLCGVEVVVWPPATARDTLAAPAAEAGRVVIPARPSQPGVGAVEVEAALRADTSADERIVHLVVGGAKATRAVAVAENLIVELDAKTQLAGFWLLDVPAFPEEVEG